MLEREIWFIIICLLTAWGLWWGLRDTRRIIEAPFLYSTGMALIICPQLYVATYNYWRVPIQAFRVFSFMVVLCTIFLFLGYSKGCKSVNPNKHMPRYTWKIDDSRLFKFGLLISILGLVGVFQLRALGEIEGLWQGWPVYWQTLSKLMLPGITLILISCFQSKKQHRLLIALSLTYFPFLNILAGRRFMAFTLPFIYLMPFLIYNPKIRIPRKFVIASLLAGLIVVYAVPYWRGEFQSGRYFEAAQEKPIGEIISDIFSDESEKTLEVIDAMIVTGAHFVTSQYGLGIDRVYNSLIQSYVPGGLLGRDFKQSLYIGTNVSQDWVTGVYGIPVAFYTAKTGFSELFGEFFFFGSFIFYGVGYLFGKASKMIFHYFDGRAIIFLCFFVTFPASMPYDAPLANIVISIPNIVIMLTSIRWCLVKQNVLPVYSDISEYTFCYSKYSI